MAPAVTVGHYAAMGDLAQAGAAGNPLASLPRAWWFPKLPGYRSSNWLATYLRYELDDQPYVPRQEDLDWLEDEAEKPHWNVMSSDVKPAQALTTDGLEVVAAGLPVPASLRLLARRPDFQRRIRSATACYLDLGDFTVSASAEDSYLIHVLSDQQWVRHWLVYVDAGGHEAVLTSGDPIGFRLPAEYPPLPPVIPVGGSGTDLEVCADSFAE